MNMELFRLINNLANKNIILDNIMIMFSKYVPDLFMGILALVFIIGVVKNKGDYRKASVNAFVLTVINLIISYIIGSVYYVDRPFVHNKVNLLYTHVGDASLPSDHATGTMSIALVLEKYNKTIGIILTILSIIVGFSRIYVGHHYPMDVISAYIVVFVGNHIYNLKFRNTIDKIYDKIENKVIEKLSDRKLNNDI